MHQISSRKERDASIVKNELMKSIAIEVQRWNANMILDRNPSERPLKNSDIADISIAVSKWQKEATEKLETLDREPAYIRTTQSNQESTTCNTPKHPSIDTSKSPMSVADDDRLNMRPSQKDNATQTNQISVMCEGFSCPPICEASLSHKSIRSEDPPLSTPELSPEAERGSFSDQFLRSRKKRPLSLSPLHKLNTIQNKPKC